MALGNAVCPCLNEGGMWHAANIAFKMVVRCTTRVGPP